MGRSSSSSTVVEHSTTDSKIKGSKTASHEMEEKEKKKLRHKFGLKFILRILKITTPISSCHQDDILKCF
jgi:hypothetical protein